MGLLRKLVYVVVISSLRWRGGRLRISHDYTYALDGLKIGPGGDGRATESSA
jgi:hypothetical protein